MHKENALVDYVASYMCEQSNKQENTKLVPEDWIDEAKWAIEALTASGNIVVPYEEKEGW